MKIVLNKGEQVFFTSDTHYNHKNINDSTTEWVNPGNKTRKGFKDLGHMNDTIVNNINNVVGENDYLIHLGDFAFGGVEYVKEFRKRILCKNIILFEGNHDSSISKNTDGIQGYFKYVIPYGILDIRRPLTFNKNNNMVEKFNFVCCHFPIASWDGMNKNNYHLFGHCHLNQQQKCLGNKSMDVGMDGNNLIPYSLDEILKLLKGQKVKSLLPFDHHVEEIR